MPWPRDSAPSLTLARSLRAAAAPARALLLLAALAACTPPQGVAYAPQQAPAFERRVITAINFDFNSARIRADSFPVLDNTATALNDPQLAGLRFEINGHTDISGRLAYNISLSGLRAAAVLNDLAARGVPPDRMHAQGFGPLQPLEGLSPASPLNRRVEIVAVQ